MFKTAGLFPCCSLAGLCVLVIALAGSISPVAASLPIQPLGIERLPNGNTLITDGGLGGLDSTARAIEVDGLGRLVWAYVKSDVPFVHTARRLVNGNTLMSVSNGNRVVEVNRNGDTVWTVAASLAYPNEAIRLENGNTLITDRDNNRIVEVSPERSIVWSYRSLSGPHGGNRLSNGSTLVCDGGNNRVIEVDAAGNIVWQHSTGLRWPRSVQRLSSGNTLITDTQHGRVIEVDQFGTIVWSAGGLTMPFAAVRLTGGNTLVSAGDHVVELTPAGDTAWQYPNTVAVVVETLQVVNPTSGCTLYVQIHRPANAGPGNRVPGAVFVPGGTGVGSSLDTTCLPEVIASDGFAFLHFDPDGRGRSSACPEDYNGYVNQDGLHACLSLLASRDYVDTSRLGVCSWGYGITMAAGAIARYPEPRVKFLLDFEGPADRSQTCQDSGGVVPVPADSEAFWQEREAARFMKQVSCAYLRIQTEVDHNPTIAENRHCIELINSATAAAFGGEGISVWTRVNDSVMNAANQVYALPSISGTPVWIPESEASQNIVRVLLYLHELADMDLSGVVAGPREAGPAGTLQAMPRPCRGVLELTLPAATSPRGFQVHDVCGRLVRSGVIPAGITRAGLDLRDMVPGAYYVAVTGAGTVPVVIMR